MLIAPEFFKAGVSGAGPSEWFFPAYMRPREETPAEWAYASNLELIDNLRGPLLLFHGTSDTNVPLAETMKVVAALTAAGKPYDLRLFPGGTHGPWGTPDRQAEEYLWRTIRAYFIEHFVRGR